MSTDTFNFNLVDWLYKLNDKSISMDILETNKKELKKLIQETIEQVFIQTHIIENENGLIELHLIEKSNSSIKIINFPSKTSALSFILGIIVNQSSNLKTLHDTEEKLNKALIYIKDLEDTIYKLKDNT